MVTVYKTQRWKTLRLQILERDGYRCTCGKPATTVHHTTPFTSANDPHAWDPTFLVSMCHACHGSIDAKRGTASRQARRAA